DQRRLEELFPAVHDTVTDQPDRQRLVERGDAARTLVGVYEAELEACRAGVDDEDVGQCGHVQPAIAGSSSPCSRVYARACSRCSCICWRRCADRSPRPGTRSITSTTRWKRSRSFSITMSKGVVV